MQRCLCSFILIYVVFISSALASKVILNGYWQNFNNPAQTPLRLIEIPATYKLIHIAFADLDYEGNVTFSLQGPPYDTMPDALNIFKNDIQSLQARGIKVFLSLGGQNGFFLVDNPHKTLNFVNSLKALIANYGFDGIDYDIENGLTSTNVKYLVDASQQLKEYFAALGKTLQFTLAPETIDIYWQMYPDGKYDALIQSGLITHVQVQLYNSGCMLSNRDNSPCFSQGSEDFIVSQADSTIQTWLKNGIQNAASKYIIGLPASPSAAAGGYVDPSVFEKAYRCLTKGEQCANYIPTQIYPDLPGFMTWSINWDAKNNYAFEKMVASLEK